MKILNLYAGIGGNRKLWGDEHEITSVEFDSAVAEAYKDRFPNDTMVVGDAKQYLLDHYKEFDFIWASPPCQSHSRARRGRVDIPYQNGNSYGAIYPDFTIYEVIVFLQNFYDGFWIVENVIPYYTPIIKPDATIDRHLYWSNFTITILFDKKMYRIGDVSLSTLTDFNLSKYKIKNKIQVIRNQVNSFVGKHILDCAVGTVQHKQGGLF